MLTLIYSNETGTVSNIEAAEYLLNRFFKDDYGRTVRDLWAILAGEDEDPAETVDGETGRDSETGEDVEFFKDGRDLFTIPAGHVVGLIDGELASLPEDGPKPADWTEFQEC